MSKFATLSKQLDRIPHLDLARQFDVLRLQEDLDRLDPEIFAPFASKSRRHAAMTAANWHGVCLIASNGELHRDLAEDRWHAPPPYLWTPAVEQTPYIKEVITTLGGEGQRARLMRIPPQGRLAWHRHGSEPSTLGEALPWRSGNLAPPGFPSNWTEVVVQVPIRTNPDFVYSVIDVVDYQTMDIGGGECPVHEQKYPTGQAWVFNSNHVHNVFNRSKTHSRYTLMLALDLRMKRTYEILAAAVDRYLSNQEGPLLRQTFDV